MARPIWTGTLSFGLLQVPVQLMSGERRAELHFRLLDSRDEAPVRYERVNSDTGEEVPWKQIVKAFEYDKGNYVVVRPEDFKAASPETADSIDIERFVDPAQVDVGYYDKPYVLVPAKRAGKGYVLLRETLRETGLAGIARIVIRTREHLAMVVAEKQALRLVLLRYPQELIADDTYELPGAGKAGLKISERELSMAAKLVKSMQEDFEPSDYRDEYRDKLGKLIEKRLADKDVVEPETGDDDDDGKQDDGKVVDFMALLKKSIADNKRQPAKAAGKKKASGKKAGKTKHDAASRKAKSSDGKSKPASKKPAPPKKKKAG
ncbi:Ku protein [Oleiagrimonas sp. C23AA]|uniref:non-homologous end joining protein Ku n=1 Tax=Oleiagrimonas sp. C23AA TaxID=2719047 RepID=UPI00141F5A73|nr:Ku protein [Oleiagrimonas sp. C23AA]